MRAPRTLRTGAMAAAVPLTVLAALCAAGALSWPAGLIAGLTVVLGSGLLARGWIRNLDQVAHRLADLVAAREAALDAQVLAERELVQRLPEPLIVLDAARRVCRMNAAAQGGFEPGFAAVLRHPGLRGALDRTGATGLQQSAELSLAVPVARDVAATVIPLEPPLADGGRFAVVLEDRTRARALERMRADFVANASHELRTPLTSLIGFIDTLRGPAADDPPAQARFLGIMAEQAERMNRLIDDLLSLSRIELTEHQAPNERVDVGALLNRAAAVFEPQLAAGRVRLELTLPGSPVEVPGDEDQLDQVLHNLLDNAIKYGRKGGVVRAAAEPARQGGRWPARAGVAITVADDGPGVARAHLPRLTERFYRADKHRSRAVGGTGLGLAIVKHIVNRHRGQLAIESLEGQGTTVTIWLPASPATVAVPEGSGAAGTA